MIIYHKLVLLGSWYLGMYRVVEGDVKEVTVFSGLGQMSCLAWPPMGRIETHSLIAHTCTCSVPNVAPARSFSPRSMLRLTRERGLGRQVPEATHQANPAFQRRSHGV